MKRILFLFLCLPLFLSAQVTEKFEVDNDYVRGLIEQYKQDRRGPYQAIRWFCKDGTINPPKEPCEGGGVQHALLKNEVASLAKKSHVFLGQILASADFDEFWDAENDHSRMKQYMLEKYLKSVDDGWVNRKAQFYRGAFQAEDETAWGKDFFVWLLQKPEALSANFYLVRQAIKDIPHSDDSNVAQEMRSQSKSLAEDFSAFMPLRVKIHGQPAKEDIDEVRAFKQKYSSQLSSSMQTRFDELVSTMEEFFAPIKASELVGRLSNVSTGTLKNTLMTKLQKLDDAGPAQTIALCAESMMAIRESLDNQGTAEARLALLDLSLRIESLLNITVSSYEPNDLESLVELVCNLSMASAASGYTEMWEWNQIQQDLSLEREEKVTLNELNDIQLAARNQLEWGTSMNKAVFDEEVKLFSGFDSKAHAFLDDRIRGSVALPLGTALGKLGAFITDQENLKNEVLDLSNQSQVHGLNPGYAFGKLYVVEGDLTNMDVDANGIYAFQRPPSDLRPVAGILNISQGNLVSHLQLLARNLGIPNTSISDNNLQELKKYNGKKVFYAVSNKGTVVIKTEDQMSQVEKDLFKKDDEVRNTEMIEVPVDRIRLDRTTTMNLTELNATSSGIYCGPKAANLGELKNNFPDHVVDGFVIPFGIFRAHLDQTIPGQNQTYWQFLKNIFATARQKTASGTSAKEVEQYQLDEFKKLSQLIIDMPMMDSFVADLENAFKTILKKPMGQQPVFLRSDTNMEDLASFTGAGINLTLFNIKDKQAIIDGIKEVWASPYGDRSFRWRQKYLNNPENVYPSIVVIPGVNNDCSGVMITKGVRSGRTDEITIAMSRGVGGAVEGQIAETWALARDGEETLISPSREMYFNRLDDGQGGTVIVTTSLDQPIIYKERRDKVLSFSKELISTMTKKGIEGPYDVELGFKDGKVWLFQVRPFVENKDALSSSYLESITPEVNMNKSILLNTRI